MALTDISIKLKNFKKNSVEHELLDAAISSRKTAAQLVEEEKYMDAMERVIDALRTLRDFPDFDNTEFRAMLVALLFDISEIHYFLKDYRQSEKETEMLFKVLDPLVKLDPERFGKYHILAMELSTRILRSRKKTLDMLVKQQLNAGALYEKVNAGVASATDKLVDSLCKVGELLASTGDYKAALKFYAEAIKFSKRRSGRITRKEVKMTIDMAQIMMRVRHMRPRAKRLLSAILPHAISLETIELEEDILALIEIINADILQEPKWKSFLHKISLPGKLKRDKKGADEKKDEEKKDAQKADKKADKKSSKTE